MQNTPGHDEACSTPCYLVCRIKTKLGDKTSRTYICIKENNIGHMMNNASHLRLPLFLWNFVVSPSGSGVTLWSAMIETNRLVLLNREAPVVPTDSARTDRIRNALTFSFKFEEHPETFSETGHRLRPTSCFGDVHMWRLADSTKQTS